jgi:hypothetical protein
MLARDPAIIASYDSIVSRAAEANKRGLETRACKGSFDVCCDFDTGCRSASTCMANCQSDDEGDIGCVAGT